MQTGSSAWWMVVDRLRDQAATAGLVAATPTLVACPGPDGPFLVVAHADPEKDRSGVAGTLPLLVGDIGAEGRHQIGLVKQPVIAGQLRLARRQACRRRGGLDADDFALLWRCLRGRDALAVLPAHHDSMSETPRTVDVFPLPLHPQVALPAAAALIRADLRMHMGSVPGWTFPHRVVAVPPDWLARPDRGGRIAWVLYLRMRRALQGKHGDGDFHLLVTRRWMWMVPRPIGAALDYAGVFAISSTAQWDGLMRSGPWAGLAGTPDEAASLCG